MRATTTLTRLGDTRRVGLLLLLVGGCGRWNFDELTHADAATMTTLADGSTSAPPHFVQIASTTLGDLTPMITLPYASDNVFTPVTLTAVPTNYNYFAYAIVGASGPDAVTVALGGPADGYFELTPELIASTSGARPSPRSPLRRDRLTRSREPRYRFARSSRKKSRSCA